MASLQTDARLFGLDLSTLWPDLKAAGAAMWTWPVLSWLTPQPAISLIRPDGSVAILARRSKAKVKTPKKAASNLASQAGSAAGIVSSPNTQPAQKATRFYAVQLPEDILLRHSVVLPSLPAPALQSALALEVQRLSPFASDATAWVSLPDPLAIAGNGAATSVQHWSLVMTSQDLVRSHLKTLESQLADVDQSTLEVWVSKAPQAQISSAGASSISDAAEYTLISGFGEGHRRQRQRLGRYINMGLMCFVVVLLAAIAVTPTLQLRLRALDAQAKYQALQKSVAPLQQQREAMVQAQSQLQSIAKIAGQPASALKLMNALTMAIPDDTSLQSLQIDASDAATKAPKVTIMGQTGNAAALMQHLGQQPGVQNVKAPSPAVRPLGAPKETFTIEMTVALSALDAGVMPAAAAPVVQPAVTPEPSTPAANASVFSR